jgi:hypothetical protein
MYLYSTEFFDVKEKRWKLKAYKNETYSPGNCVIKSIRCEHSYVTKAQYFSLVDMMKYNVT